MNCSRRRFLEMSAALTVAATCRADEKQQPSKQELDRILDAPVLATDLMRQPVKVASIELVKSGETFLLRTRSTDGVEAITVPHPSWTTVTFPILLNRIIPVFVNQDA